jgi:hypothetical protein
MILEAHEQVVTHLHTEFTHRTRVATAGFYVDKSQSVVALVALDAERVAKNLKTGAYCHHTGSVTNPRRETAFGEQVARQALGAVLTTAKKVQRRVGNFTS